MADIDIGQILEKLNDKEDRDQRNVDTAAKADAVIDYQEPTSANGYTWYRKYASGWVEQGGEMGTNSVISLPVTMENTYYYVSVSWCGGKAQNFYATDFKVRNRTTTSFETTATSNGTNVKGISWEVKGKSAN